MSSPTLGAGPAHYLRPSVILAGSTLTPLAGPRVYLGGYAFAEATGAANAQINIINGQDINGPVIIPVTLNPGQSVRDHFGEHHLLFESGCTVNVVVGSVSGSVWLRYP